ncbi:MAG: hypothetical protein Q8T04_09150 [Bacteroidota bacterium]|nr:hypothetical protein [Bacteroidota bacterium]MDP3433114.1 hypothetical protein [Bacteroidota bacterium]
MDINKRQENEKKFSNYEDLPNGFRLYWFEIEGRMGWKARYVKIVDQNETTISFRQEIYNENELLVEVHEKYPIDNGHIKIVRP